MVERTFSTSGWFRVIQSVFTLHPEARTDNPESFDAWLQDHYQAQVRKYSGPGPINWEIIVEFADPRLATEFILRYA